MSHYDNRQQLFGLSLGGVRIHSLLLENNYCSMGEFFTTQLQPTSNDGQCPALTAGKMGKDDCSNDENDGYNDEKDDEHDDDGDDYCRPAGNNRPRKIG